MAQVILIISLIFFGGLQVSSATDKIRYDGYRVYSVVPDTAEQLEKLMELEGIGFKFWSYPKSLGGNVDIMVAPSQANEFDGFLSNYNLQSGLMVDNVQGLIDKEQTSRTERDSGNFGWSAYYSLDEIYDWMQLMAERFPEIATIVQGGSSHENRQILGLKLEFGKNFPAIVVEGNIHAREWITSATTTWITNQILTNETVGIVRQFNWYIFPVTNPDGYEFSRNVDRAWRKTRKRSLLCYGADPNRNFDYHWMEGGASSNPCSDIYAGSSPFSEIEAKSFAEFMQGVPNLQVHISFHSYGHLLMLPYGYTKAKLDNYNETYAIAGNAVKKLAERYGTIYKYGNIAETIYIDSGSSTDWVKGVLKTRFCFAYEFRDKGRYGFILPADQIIPNSEEVYDSVVEILENVKGIIDAEN